ncbi:hypothetical protein [Natrononativus amylolyticus]|uniref:hypothetical protein n=1 Tax=Natrononativus amylolyticus TaxID=2963434 RepID=UPI0020CC4055|nr:hypothetical protein [Natrononativus amylolyticus]
MPASDAADGRLTLSRIDSVPASSRVRHVDELADEELTRFTELLESDLAATDDAGFALDDVIVFTEYYRVTQG